MKIPRSMKYNGKSPMNVKILKKIIIAFSFHSPTQSRFNFFRFFFTLKKAKVFLGDRQRQKMSFREILIGLLS
jgi:hypothetical protein